MSSEGFTSGRSALIGQVSAWAERHPFRAFVVAVTGAALIVVALLPLALRMDDRAERVRPMYDDLARLHEVQAALTDRGGAPTPMTVEPGRTVTDGGLSFTSSPGVRLTVETSGSGYCARAENRRGERTLWQCVDNGETTIRYEDEIPAD